jgi:hypothetical protein
MKKLIIGDFVIVNGILGANTTNKKDVVVKVTGINQDGTNLSKKIFIVKSKAWGRFITPTSVQEQYVRRVATKEEIVNSDDYGYLQENI